MPMTKPSAPTRAIRRHVLAPALLPAVFMLIAATPVELLGCRLRGLLAAGVALASGIAAVGAAAWGLRCSLKNQPGHAWWTLSALILAVPVAALLVLA
jgi:hypothetical protein